LRQAKQYGNFMPPSLFAQVLKHLGDLQLLEPNNTVLTLYNWGEPLLHPHLNDILAIVQEKCMQANLSSNFMVRPHIETDVLPVIRTLIFSISGFSQSTYGRVHGGDLKKVLAHFNEFYEKIRTYSPKAKIFIAWHRYPFNEHEFWEAYHYFQRPGIFFKPIIAMLNDLLELLAFLEGNLTEERLQQVEKELFMDHICRRIAYHRSKSNGFRCPAQEHLVIDETGQLLLCCGVTRFDTAHVLGNVLELSAAEIWARKRWDPLCKKCLSSGVARWTYKQDVGGFHDYPWPSGGGLDFLKLWLQSNFYYKLEQNIRNLPGGEGLADALKKLKKAVSRFS
jgi:MoaA/NifB/PqqE/SkfB family radical SAM enzyme